MHTKAWVADELQYAQLGDTRRHQRLIRIVSDMADHPTATIPESCGSWSATKAAYRFWSNPHVDAASIRQAHQQRTFARLAERSDTGEPQTFLIVQDTTNLTFNTQRRRKQDLGYLDHANQWGLKQHSALAVSSEGVPQGIVYQEIWARDPDNYGKKHQRRKKNTQDKESQRWIRTTQAIQEKLQEQDTPNTRWIMVADREADLYDYLAMERPRNVELLVRVAQTHRCVHGEAGHLLQAVQDSPIVGTVQVEIQPSGNRSARQATLTVRYQKLRLKPPQNRKVADRGPEVPGWVILAEEVTPAEGIKPIVWVLWSSLEVACFEDAVLYLHYYALRWLVERYHFVLKGGCCVEELQLATADRIERAVATLNVVAWRLLWLTYESRRCPEQSCDGILESHEWEALALHRHQKHGEPMSFPLTPPTLAQAVTWIAQLGGFLGRRGDGEPGVKTLWRGLRHLHDLASMWRLCRDSIGTQHSGDPPGSLSLPDLNLFVGKG